MRGSRKREGQDAAILPAPANDDRKPAIITITEDVADGTDARSILRRPHCDGPRCGETLRLIIDPIAGARVRARRKWPVSGESGRVHDPIATRPKHDLQRDR